MKAKHRIQHTVEEAEYVLKALTYYYQNCHYSDKKLKELSEKFVIEEHRMNYNLRARFMRAIDKLKNYNF